MAGQVGRIRCRGGQHVADTHGVNLLRGQTAGSNGCLGGMNLKIKCYFKILLTDLVSRNKIRIWMEMHNYFIT